MHSAEQNQVCTAAMGQPRTGADCAHDDLLRCYRTDLLHLCSCTVISPTNRGHHLVAIEFVDAAEVAM
jgi:hypothetical protein